APTEADKGEARPNDEVFDTGPKAMSLQEHVVPDVCRYEHGGKARDEVADDERFAQHVDVGEGVARRVCPRGFRTQLPAPRRAFELRLAFLADADHRLVVVTGDDAGLQPLTGLHDDRTAHG